MSDPRTILPLLVLVAVACGGTDEPSAQPGAQRSPEVEAPAEPSTAQADDLVGTWRASIGGGGPIAATLEYELRADGTYDMTGYPSIAERGRYRVESREGDAITLRLTERLRCGPCEAAGPTEPLADASEVVTLSPDGTLTLGGNTYARISP